MHTDTLHRLVALAALADAGSLTGAARRMGLVKSSVSHHIATLERETGVRLVDRGWRNLALTAIGHELAAHGRIIARAAADALLASRAGERPEGVLRISTPAGIADALLVPMLAGFRCAYPGIGLEIVAVDAILDLGAERLDAAFRIGGVADGPFIARLLHVGRDVFVAAPRYLATNPPIAGPADLAAHRWVGFTAFGRRVSFALQDSQDLRSEVEVDVALTTSNGLAIREWAIEGAGLARLPDFAVAAALAAGHLVRVLPGHTAGAPALSVAYLPERFRPANVRRLTDFAQDWFAKRRSPSC